MFTLADISELLAETDVDELYSSQIRPGLKALLKPAGGTVSQSGKVSFAAPTVDPQTGGRAVKISFDVPVSLPIGLTVNANIVVADNGRHIRPAQRRADRRHAIVRACRRSRDSTRTGRDDGRLAGRATGDHHRACCRRPRHPRARQSEGRPSGRRGGRLTLPFFLKVAFRYLTANKAQTALLVSGVAVGVFVFVS